MKKYLLSLAAIVLAVGLSAFNAPKDSKVDLSYYWYSISGTNLGSRLGDVAGQPVMYTQTQAKNQGLTSCNDSGSIACIVGDPQSNQAGNPLPTETSNGDNYIERTNP